MCAAPGQVLPNLRPGYVELARSIEVVASSGGGSCRSAVAAPAAALPADGSGAAAAQSGAAGQPAAAASAVDMAAASGSEAGDDADSEGEVGSDDDAGAPGASGASALVTYQSSIRQWAHVQNLFYMCRW